MHRAFTLIELLIIIGIVAVLAALATPALHSFQSASDLENSAEEVSNALRLAHQKTISSDGDSSWGIYFSTTSSQYVLFKGADYSSRDVAVDKVHDVPSFVSISNINLGGGLEEVFNKVSGAAKQQGSISLILTADPSKTKTIYIEESGQVGFSSPITPSDINRIKDSRHVQVDYSRNISTSTESLILTFFYDISTQVETIAIADWEGEFDVGGQIQKIKIHTHRLNQPDTQFSVHRDIRYNTRALKIKLSGDSSGNFIEYSADGLNTISTSLYAANIQWQ